MAVPDLNHIKHPCNSVPSISTPEFEMASNRQEDDFPLLSSEAPTTQNPRNPSRNVRDLHFLSAMFVFVFLAYHAAQNLESSLNSDEDLGTTSLGILYFTFTLCSIIATPFVKRFGSRNSLILGTTGYWLFIASNIFPSWYTMVPASLYLGFTSSIIWVGEGTYLTSAARSHAAEQNLPEGTVLGSFNGEFWGSFASTQVVGNLFALALLQNKKEGENSGTTLLFVVFLASMTIGTMLAFFLSNQGDSQGRPSSICIHTPGSSVTELFRATFVPLHDKKLLVLIPMLIYSGLEQAFVWAEFTKSVVKPKLGVQGVGAIMAVFGAADASFSLISGRLTTNLLSITIITFAGIFCQALVLFGLLLDGRVSDLLVILTVAVLWGIGDGILNTQISATLGLLFPLNTEAIFSQLKIWQCGAIAVIFIISPHISFGAMLITLIVALCLASGGFLVVTQVLARSI